MKQEKKIIHKQDYLDERSQLLIDTICKGASPHEMELFLHVCRKTNLDPFMRQIWPVFRYNKDLRRDAMTIQVGIDGFRTIAERTGKYSPGQEPSYRYDENGNLISATAFVKKMTSDGTWHEVSANALLDEYVARKKDGNPTSFWENKPHIMLAKCAEALALRRAFPAEMSGIYSEEEMQQAENPSTEIISREEYAQIEKAINGEEEIETYFRNRFETTDLSTITKTQKTQMLQMIKKRNENKKGGTDGSRVA